MKGRPELGRYIIFADHSGVSTALFSVCRACSSHNARHTKARPGERISGPHDSHARRRVGLLAEGDDAKGAATVIVVAGGEEELVGIAIGTGALAELNSPNIVDLDYLSARVAEWA